MDFEILDVGDKVKHPKFGNGTVINRSGDNENQKVTVKFGAEFGEKKLVTKLANMKRISERPTLQATPGAPGAFPGAAAAGAVAGGAIPVTRVPAKSALDDEPEETDAGADDLEDEELEDDEDLGDEDEDEE